jgi:glycosyltransferase involved in cell wall biosynthesis
MKNDFPGKVAVIIPALNEEASILKVLDAIPKGLVDLVIVADNGSEDATANLAAKWGAEVVRENEKGYGAACLKGLEALPEDVDTIVFLDADYSDDPRDMKLLLGKIEEGYDLVIGSRLLGRAEAGALLPQARFGNRLACFLMRCFYGFSYTDLGPFRAIRRGALHRIGMRDRAFGWTVEMQIRALQESLNVCEVSVAYKKRIGLSKITGTLSGTFKAGTTILWIIFKNMLKFPLSQSNSMGEDPEKI